MEEDWGSRQATERLLRNTCVAAAIVAVAALIASMVF